MAAHTTHASPLARSLILGALGLAVGGCWSSDRTSQLASGRREATPPIVVDEAATEPAPMAEKVEPSAISPSTEVGPPRTQPGSESEGIAGPGGSQETVGPAELEQTVAPAESAKPPVPVEAERPGGPRIGSNPLRSGNEGAPGPRLTSVQSTSVETSGSGKGKGGEVKFDWLKENGPIFAGWPPPRLALVITGRQDGYLEPCGCAGLDRMKGGLSRRLSMFEQLRKDWGPVVVAVDVGGLSEGFGPQADLKLQTTINAMQAMQYDVIALGKSDLQFSMGQLLYAGTGKGSPFVSANAALVGFEPEDSWYPMRIVEAGGMKLGITSILGKKWQREINNPDVAMADPKEKLAEVVPALRQGCDLLILLAHATREETDELAKEFPQFDVVVTAGGRPEPPEHPQRIDGSNRLLIDVGEKGMYAVVLGFFDDPAQPIRDQRVPLDARFPQADHVKELMAQYQDTLRDFGLEGLGVTPVPYPGNELMGRFVGTEKCKSCHEESYKVWKKSGHAKAWQTLVELDPPRHFDPECITCHVVGWTPQNYRPFESGFLSEETTPQLIDVGCETCHGPGEKHCEAEIGGDFDLQEKLRKLAVITLEDSQQAVSTAITDRQHCRNCHDLDNSPDFDFDTYWLKIEHREE